MRTLALTYTEIRLETQSLYDTGEWCVDADRSLGEIGNDPYDSALVHLQQERASVLMRAMLYQSYA